MGVATPVTVITEVPEPNPPQSTVVYVQPTASPGGANWALWITLLVLLLLVGGGLALWSSGMLNAGDNDEGLTNTPTNVTIENSPQMSTEQQSDSADQLPAEPAEPLPAEPAPDEPAVVPDSTPTIDIISVEGEVLERFATEWRYGYTVRVRNNSATDVTTSIRVQFMDEQGFPVDDDVLENLVIPANTERTFDGDDMLSVDLAQRVRTLLANQR